MGNGLKLTFPGYMFDLTSGLSPEMLKSLGLPSIEPPANVPKCDAVSQGELPCTRSGEYHHPSRLMPLSD
jgi:hypothetical protein